MLNRNQVQSGRWAAKMLDQPTLRILDTETTGLNAPEILELGIVSVSGEVLYHGRFRPMTAIDPGAARVHGLTAALLAHEPAWSEQWPQIRELLEGYPVVIYNARFDLRAIAHTCALYNVECPPLVRVPAAACVMEQYARWVGQRSQRGGYTWQKLPQFKDLPAHSAVGDALATLRLMRQMAQAVTVPQEEPAHD